MDAQQRNDDIAQLFRDNDDVGADSNVLLRPMRRLLAQGATLGPMTALTFNSPGEKAYPFGVLTWTENNRLVFWPILPNCPTMTNIVDHITLEFPGERSHLTYYTKSGKAKHISAANLNNSTAWRLVPFPDTGIALWFAMSVKTSALFQQDMAVQRRVAMPTTDRERRINEYVRHLSELNFVDVPLPPDQSRMPSYVCCNVYLVTDPSGNVTVTPDSFVQAWRDARIDGWTDDALFTIQPMKLDRGGHQFVVATACPPGECADEVNIGMPRPRV